MFLPRLTKGFSKTPSLSFLISKRFSSPRSQFPPPDVQFPPPTGQYPPIYLPEPASSPSIPSNISTSIHGSSANADEQESKSSRILRGIRRFIVIFYVSSELLDLIEYLDFLEDHTHLRLPVDLVPEEEEAHFSHDSGLMLLLRLIPAYGFGWGKSPSLWMLSLWSLNLIHRRLALFALETRAPSWLEQALSDRSGRWRSEPLSEARRVELTNESSENGSVLLNHHNKDLMEHLDFIDRALKSVGSPVNIKPRDGTVTQTSTSGSITQNMEVGGGYVTAVHVMRVEAAPKAGLHTPCLVFFQVHRFDYRWGSSASWCVSRIEIVSTRGRGGLVLERALDALHTEVFLDDIEL
jgi:hypothetical protein